MTENDNSGLLERLFNKLTNYFVIDTFSSVTMLLSGFAIVVSIWSLYIANKSKNAVNQANNIAQNSLNREIKLERLGRYNEVKVLALEGYMLGNRLQHSCDELKHLLSVINLDEINDPELDTIKSDLYSETVDKLIDAMNDLGESYYGMFKEDMEVLLNNWDIGTDERIEGAKHTVLESMKLCENYLEANSFRERKISMYVGLASKNK